MPAQNPGRRAAGGATAPVDIIRRGRSVGHFNLALLLNSVQNLRELRLQPWALEFAVEADRRLDSPIRPKFGQTILVTIAGVIQCCDIVPGADAMSLGDCRGFRWSGMSQSALKDCSSHAVIICNCGHSRRHRISLTKLRPSSKEVPPQPHRRSSSCLQIAS